MEQADKVEPLLSPVGGNEVGNEVDPESLLSPGVSKSSPRASSPNKRNLGGTLVARMTTCCLVPAANGEFEGTSEKVDKIFEEHILPQTQTKNGYVDAVRFFDGASGDYVLISFWETEEDALETTHSKYYPAAQQRLWPYVRFNMFKTEHFKVSV